MKRVLMIGGAGTLSPVPPIVEDQERWGLNNLITLPTGPKLFKGCTRWFDVHHKDHIVGRRKANVWGWYRKLTIPLYLCEAYDDLPTSEAYPLAEVQDMFDGTRLFTSSLDYMLAFALLKGFEEIELYRFRMGNPRYLHQVSSGRWWLNECFKRGVTVKHMSPSALARDLQAFPPNPMPNHLMYGFETTDRRLLYRSR